MAIFQVNRSIRFSICGGPLQWEVHARRTGMLRAELPREILRVTEVIHNCPRCGGPLETGYPEWKRIRSS
jgi:hypothetical protein